MAYPLLPDELTELTFNNLDVVSLLRCMQVCKLFHSIISRTTHLVYKIELFASHLEDGNHSSLDTVSRLKALREYNRAWNDMKWTHNATVPMRDGRCWELSGGILAQATFQNEILSIQLPCKVKGIPEKRWTVPFDFTIRDFTSDNSQGLLALIERSGTLPDVSYKIHLRTLAGEPHPRAVVPLVTHAPQSAHDQFLFLIQICGPHIAVLFINQLGAATPDMLLVWNWHTGQQKVYMRVLQLCSFAFMTEDLILVAIVRSVNEPCLVVLSIAACGNPIQAFEDMTYICELQYPALKYDVEDILIRSEPTPSWRPPASLAVPFYVSRKDFIFTISLRVTAGHEIRENTLLFVPLSTLLSQVALSYDAPQRRIAWKEWGPKGTRMIFRESSEIWVCYTHGMRFIQGLRWKDGHKARVYDFNPYAARKYEGIDSSVKWKPLARKATMKVQSHAFAEEVVTTLPGRVAMVDLAHSKDGCEAAMIGENNIVMVQRDGTMYGYMAM
ncbi:hypothetical protein PAXRUDRAFT_822178 [Paxillus rubicundulus Ve08.2h10]|uniref:F-box domain-containing protein n=1 Tax=Paxillus rubicundulus Ve08.2h10 TaxID=930991 RepID=A0A0D0E5M3_9AGAM|nr:hypothetical protein PAXRUDRAFT_822178 [Paxillus rubicundulus Ve08.2h10]